MLWPVGGWVAEFNASDGGRRGLQNQFPTLDSHRFEPAWISLLLPFRRFLRLVPSFIEFDEPLVGVVHVISVRDSH
jgi:hypothetical protein